MGFWLLYLRDLGLLGPVSDHALKKYCHAAHSQIQNKGFLADENQDPIFI